MRFALNTSVVRSQKNFAQNQYKYANLEHKYNPSPTRTKKGRRANRRSGKEKSRNNGSQPADDNPALNIAAASAAHVQTVTTTINSSAALRISNMFAVYRHWRGLGPPRVDDHRHRRYGPQRAETFSAQSTGINKRRAFPDKHPQR